MDSNSRSPDSGDTPQRPLIASPSIIFRETSACASHQRLRPPRGNPPSFPGKSPVPRKGRRSTPPGPLGACISENVRASKRQLVPSRTSEGFRGAKGRPGPGKSPVPRKGPRSAPPGPLGACISENARVEASGNSFPAYKRETSPIDADGGSSLARMRRSTRIRGEWGWPSLIVPFSNTASARLSSGVRSSVIVPALSAVLSQSDYKRRPLRLGAIAKFW
jgi:hypothetical protein